MGGQDTLPYNFFHYCITTEHNTCPMTLNLVLKRYRLASSRKPTQSAKAPDWQTRLCCISFCHSSILHGATCWYLLAHCMRRASNRSTLMIRLRITPPAILQRSHVSGAQSHHADDTRRRLSAAQLLSRSALHSSLSRKPAHTLYMGSLLPKSYTDSLRSD